MLQRTIHALEVVQGCSLVIFETHDEAENGDMQHILVWFTKFNDKFYGDFVQIKEDTDLPELVAVLKEQATNTLTELNK